MIFLASQFQRFGRALRIWIILSGLFFYLWFDSKKWTYLKGYTTKRREKRNTLRAKWLTNELINSKCTYIQFQSEDTKNPRSSKVKADKLDY